MDAEIKSRVAMCAWDTRPCVLLLSTREPRVSPVEPSPSCQDFRPPLLVTTTASLLPILPASRPGRSLSIVTEGSGHSPRLSRPLSLALGLKS